MKRILLLIGVLFASQSFAVTTTNFCSAPSMADQDDCVSTCAAIADANAYDLAKNEYGYCEGVATQLTEQVFKIELGQLVSGNDKSRCTIWEGDDMTLEGGGSTKAVLSSKYPVSLKNCTVGTTYNAMYFTLARYVKFAGEAVFPDGSEKVVRTTSAYAGKSSYSDTPVSTWRDSGLTDTDKYYTQVDQYNSGNSKKLAVAPSNIDLFNKSNITMSWDEVKNSYTWGGDMGKVREGFICEGDDVSVCTGDIQDDRFVGIMPSEIMIGFPYTMKKGDETLDLEWIRYSSVLNGINQSKGIRFLWLNDGGTLKYVGVGVTYDGASLKISNARSNNGLRGR